MQSSYSVMFLQHARASVRGFIYMLLTAGPLCANTSFAATPDFSGIWTRDPALLDAGQDEGDQDEGDQDGAPDAEEQLPPGGMPSFKEPYAQQFKVDLKRRADAQAQGIELVNPSTLCRPEGMPGIMDAVYDLEILQTPKQIVVLAEYLSQIRRVYLNEKMPALEDISPSYNGHAVGHWEGDTLVIKTMGVREDVQFTGMPHSAQMQITERWRLIGADDLENKVRIDDPQVLAKPYEYTYEYKRHKGYRIVEYICDNNRNTVDSEGKVDLKIPPATH